MVVFETEAGSGKLLILGLVALIFGVQAGRAVRMNPARALRNA